MKTLYLILLLAICGLSEACHSATAKDIITYINNPANGVLQERKQAGKTMRVQYLPTDVQLLSEYGAIPAKEIAAGRKKFEHYDYFKLVVYDELFTASEETLSYLNFGLSPELQLIRHRTDTIPCTFFQPIATGSKHRYEFIAVFEKDEKHSPSDFRFVFTDKVFGFGRVAFDFNDKSLQNIPHL